jgi:hypothetical protein
MTRRELLALGKNLFISLFLGRSLVGCRPLGKNLHTTSQLAHLLGYLLYEDNPPVKGIEEIEKHLNKIAQRSLKKQLELEWLYLRISLKIRDSSFETLSPENKMGNFEAIMAMLVHNPEIFDALQMHLQGEHVLEYLDYPDLPGEYAECGWLVIEGAVWDRYYPPSGS